MEEVILLTKRKNGEGNWGKKVINGTEYNYFRKQYPGIKNRTYFYGKTTEEVLQKKENFEKDLERKRITTGSSKNTDTFGNAITAWLQNVKIHELSPGTYDGYERAINNRIKNFKEYDLWNKQMKQINSNAKTAIDIFQCYMDALVEHGYALKTIREIRDIIYQFCKYSSNPVRHDFDYNYMEYVSEVKEDNVKKKAKETHFMDEHEVETLYREAKRINTKGICKGGSGIGKPVYGNNAYAIIILMYTGLRVSELCALKWSDVDLENGTIFIHRSLRLIKNRNVDAVKNGTENKTIYIEKETKTKNGRRTITITNRVMEALIYFKNLKIPNKDGYVCISKNGTHMRREGIARTLKRMTMSTNLYPYSVHELRHSFGSILLEKSDNQDRAIAAISRILGHATVSITYNIYIHILDKRLTTTFQLVDKHVVQRAFTGEDYDELEDDDKSIEEKSYKEKYEELMASVQTFQTLFAQSQK